MLTLYYYIDLLFCVSSIFRVMSPGDFIILLNYNYLLHIYSFPLILIYCSIFAFASYFYLVFYILYKIVFLPSLLTEGYGWRQPHLELVISLKMKFLKLFFRV